MNKPALAIDDHLGAASKFGTDAANGCFGPGLACMSNRLVALDEGSDIPIDRAMVVVGRHPQCDARLDSIRVSRRHCCMAEDHGEIVVRDLGSTNGIRINGQRVESGRLRPGDELSIAHYRYRLEEGHAHQLTLADPSIAKLVDGPHLPYKVAGAGLSDSHDPIPDSDDPVPIAAAPRTPAAGVVRAPAVALADENRLAAAVREMLPPGLADRCRIQVIVQVPPEDDGIGEAEEEEAAELPDPCRPDSSP